MIHNGKWGLLKYTKQFYRDLQFYFPTMKTKWKKSPKISASGKFFMSWLAASNTQIYKFHFLSRTNGTQEIFFIKNQLVTIPVY